MKNTAKLNKMLGLSQSDVAMLMGITRSQWSMFESGKRKLPPQANLLLSAILNHLKNLQLEVTDAGKKIVVPSFFGSPEQWTSAQRDGYIRDKQGKLMLPVIVLKRTSSEDDQTLQFFNRYLTEAAIKLYSSKNKYTQFSLLTNQNAPVNEVYKVVVPDHVVLTYHFVIWTEYVEQMNELVAKFKFNTNDYWGSKKGFRFRVKAESYSHTTEIKSGDDRMVRTEFDLTTHGYILPEMMVKLENNETTFKKMFTPKKVILGAELVNASFDMAALDPNKEKWRNPMYPNLQKDVVITPPPISVSDDIQDNSIVSQIQTALRATTSTKTPITISDAIASIPALRIVPIPTTNNSAGSPGDVSYDTNYLYIYNNSGWHTIPISSLA